MNILLTLTQPSLKSSFPARNHKKESETIGKGISMSKNIAPSKKERATNSCIGTIKGNKYAGAGGALKNIISRNFDKQIYKIGLAHGVYIDIYKALRKELGKNYDYVAAIIELSRRFGHCFHFSNEQFIEFAPHFSDRTLKRRKVEGAEYVVVKHCVKNRSIYSLNLKWFEAFIYRVLNELGIQQGQNGPSHIISNDPIANPSSSFESHNHKAVLDEYDIFKSGEEMKNVVQMNKLIDKIGGQIVNKETEDIHPVFKRQGQEAIIESFNPDERAIYEKLIELKVYKHLAIKWVHQHTIAELANLIEATKIYGADKPGAYIYQAVKNLSEHKEHKPFIDPICYKPWEPGATYSKSSKESGLAALKKIKEIVG